jgi:hypothetical protein
MALQLKFGDTVKSGVNVTDTYEKMLTQVNMVTPIMAKAIINRYPTIDLLYQAFSSRPVEKGHEVLIGIQVIFHLFIE